MTETEQTILRLRQWSGMRYGRDLNDIHNDVQVLLCEYDRIRMILSALEGSATDESISGV